MDAASYGNELIKREFVRKPDGSPYVNPKATEKRYFTLLSKTTNATPDQARAKLQGRVRSMEDATWIMMSEPRSHRWI